MPFAYSTRSGHERKTLTFLVNINMKHIVTVLSFLCIASIAFAQTPGMPPPHMPGSRMMEPPVEPVVLKSSYPDSVAFNAEFKELYPLVKPSPSIKERAETMLAHMGTTYKTQDIDSAKAHDTVMKILDLEKDKQLLFNAYRAQFSAEELKPIIAFFKTSAGKHYLEVESYLYSARLGQIDQYVRGNVYGVLKRMGKPGQSPNAMMRKPPVPGMSQPGMNPPGMAPQQQTPPAPPIKN